MPVGNNSSDALVGGVPSNLTPVTQQQSIDWELDPNIIAGTYTTDDGTIVPVIKPGTVNPKINTGVQVPSVGTTQIQGDGTVLTWTGIAWEDRQSADRKKIKTVPTVVQDTTTGKIRDIAAEKEAAKIPTGKIDTTNIFGATTSTEDPKLVALVEDVNKGNKTIADVFKYIEENPESVFSGAFAYSLKKQLVEEASKARSLKGDELFTANRNLGFIPNDAVYVTGMGDGQYFSKETWESLPEQVRDEYKGKGYDAGQKLVNDARDKIKPYTTNEGVNLVAAIDNNIDSNTLQIAGFSQGDIDEAKKTLEYSRKMKKKLAPYTDADGNVDLQAALDSGIGYTELKNAGFKDEDIQKAGATIALNEKLETRGYGNDKEGYNYSQALADGEISEQQAELIVGTKNIDRIKNQAEAIKKLKPYITDDGKINLTAAIQAGVPDETLKAAGIDNRDIVSAKEAIITNKWLKIDAEKAAERAQQNITTFAGENKITIKDTADMNESEMTKFIQAGGNPDDLVTAGNNVDRINFVIESVNEHIERVKANTETVNGQDAFNDLLKSGIIPKNARYTGYDEKTGEVSYEVPAVPQQTLPPDLNKPEYTSDGKTYNIAQYIEDKLPGLTSDRSLIELKASLTGDNRFDAKVVEDAFQTALGNKYFKYKNTELPDGSWIDNKELARIKENNTVAYDILTNDGYNAYQEAIKKAEDTLARYQDKNTPDKYRLPRFVYTYENSPQNEVAESIKLLFPEDVSKKMIIDVKLPEETKFSALLMQAEKDRQLGLLPENSTIEPTGIYKADLNRSIELAKSNYAPIINEIKNPSTKLAAIAVLVSTINHGNPEPVSKVALYVVSALALVGAAAWTGAKVAAASKKAVTEQGGQATGVVMAVDNKTGYAMPVAELSRGSLVGGVLSAPNVKPFSIVPETHKLGFDIPAQVRTDTTDTTLPMYQREVNAIYPTPRVNPEIYQTPGTDKLDWRDMGLKEQPGTYVNWQEPVVVLDNNLVVPKSALDTRSVYQKYLDEGRIMIASSAALDTAESKVKTELEKITSTTDWDK
ncbi:MAG: hypothetical protein PHQ86_07500, partial [Dehalococcoidales bacterium]|nr:hypothetical protein [Dehalococcoidales bacterium]